MGVGRITCMSLSKQSPRLPRGSDRSAGYGKYTAKLIHLQLQAAEEEHTASQHGSSHYLPRQDSLIYPGLYSHSGINMLDILVSQVKPRLCNLCSLVHGWLMINLSVPNRGKAESPDRPWSD